MSQAPGTAFNMAMQQQQRMSMQPQTGEFNHNSSPYGNVFAQQGRPQMMGDPSASGGIPKMMPPASMNPTRPPMAPMTDATGRPIQMQGGPPISTPSPFLNMMRNPQAMGQPQQMHMQQPQDMYAMQQQQQQQPQQQQVFTKSMFQQPQYQVPVASHPSMMAAMQQQAMMQAQAQSPYVQPAAQPAAAPPPPQQQPTIIQQQVSPVKWVEFRMLKYVGGAPVRWTMSAANQTDWFRLEEHKTVTIREEGLYTINVAMQTAAEATDAQPSITVSRGDNLPVIKTAKGTTHGSATVRLSSSDVLSVLLDTEAGFAEWTIAFLGK